MARRVRSGELPAPDDDVAAARYGIVDRLLTDAGMAWYEVSNWARPGGECRHNLGYWHDDDWWGIGPGAHSHRDGVRWWNVKHPRTYADRLAAGQSPEEDREVLTPVLPLAEALLEHETIEGRHVLEILQFGEIRSPIVMPLPPKLDEKSSEKKNADPATSPGDIGGHAAPAPHPA